VCHHISTGLYPSNSMADVYVPGGWTGMNWEWLVRKRSCTNLGTIPEFEWMYRVPSHFNWTLPFEYYGRCLRTSRMNWEWLVRKRSCTNLGTIPEFEWMYRVPSHFNWILPFEYYGRCLRTLRRQSIRLPKTFAFSHCTATAVFSSHNYGTNSGLNK